MDKFFLRVMKIYCIFLVYDKLSDQQILNWFSHLVSISEECDLDDQTISHPQDSYLTTKDTGYIISYQHSNVVMGESLSETLHPLASECEPFTISPSKNHESTSVFDKSLIEEISSSS
jgi:hypothetical protein